MVHKLSYFSDDMHFAIASVAGRSAFLDHMIVYTLDAVLTDFKRTRKHLSKQSEDRILSLLKPLLVDEFPESEDEIDALISRIAELRKARNEVIHWVSGRANEDGSHKFADMRPHREEREKTVTVEHVSEIADGMGEVAGELEKWSTKCFDRALERVKVKAELSDLRRRSGFLRELDEFMKTRAGGPGLLNIPPSD